MFLNHHTIKTRKMLYDDVKKNNYLIYFKNKIMSSKEKQSNPNGPSVKKQMYPCIADIPLGKYKAVGNTPYMDTQLIPIDATMGYESLTHNVPQAPSSYFDVSNAYPSVPNGTCTSFVFRKCDGFVENKYITDSLPQR